MSPKNSKLYSLINFIILLFSIILIYIDFHNVWGWIIFYIFGTSMLVLLYFLIDNSPNKNKKLVKSLHSVREDDGIFEYTDSGFYIWDGAFISKIDWYFIVRIAVAKNSDSENECTEMLIETFDDRIVLNDSMHGWEKLMVEINRNLPIQNRNWITQLSSLSAQKPMLIYHKNQYHYS